jgi:hypothetical protein
MVNVQAVIIDLLDDQSKIYRLTRLRLMPLTSVHDFNLDFCDRGGMHRRGIFLAGHESAASSRLVAPGNPN